MIEAIPNQPIALGQSRLVGCCSLDPEDCLLVDTSDTVEFQVKAERCAADDQLVADPGFDDTSAWTESGWTISGSLACVSLPVIPTLGPTYVLETAALTLVDGDRYEVVINFSSLNLGTGGRGVDITVGGVLLGTVSAPGIYTYFLTAVSTQGLYVDAGDLGAGGSACLDAILIFERSVDYTVEFLDLNGTAQATIDSTTDPDMFLLDQDRLTFSVSAADLEIVGCHTIRITDNCDDVALESQCVNIGDHSCTLSIKVCGSNDILGFTSTFQPSIRIQGEVRRPTYEYEVGEERLSNGKLNRFFAERTRKLELAVSRVGYSVHEFLSSLPLWDHVYIGQEAYVVVADSYEPEYADVYSGYGAVVMKITPYIEEARKVRCAEDDGGCSPPPNYWVQGTGPNEDYVLTEDGNRILINV